MDCGNVSNNTINFSLMGDENEEKNLITFFFVEKDGGMSGVMKLAYEATREKFSDPDAIKTISQDECCNLHKAKLKENKNVFVFDDFDKKNEAFNYIFTAKTVYILGTRCLLTIMLEGIPTPAGMYHIHNLAMRNLVITTTSMPKEEKSNIKELVNFMAGIYTDSLKDVVTHLVSSSVRSVKYETAAKNNVLIMHPSWVLNVWEKTQNTSVNIVAADECFDRFKLPVLYNLCITSTGLKIHERNNIKALIEESGGNYSSSFTNAVDILIMEEESIGSEKFKAAMNRKKTCLTPSWITESIQAGYAVPFDSFRIVDPNPKASMKASTPTKVTNVTISKFNPDSTALSDISQITTHGASRSININETQLGFNTRAVTRRTMTFDLRDVAYKKTLDKITLHDAKKCGNLLDGYVFFLSGFTVEELQFLGKVLSVLGATKIDVISDQVSHVIFGSTDPGLLVELDEHNVEPIILTVDWLSKVVEEKAQVDEAPYEIKRQKKERASLSNPSPASKKAMKSLSEVFKKPLVSKLQLESNRNAEDEQEIGLVSQYLHQPMAESVEEDSEKNESNFVPFLTGKYVFVFGFNDPLQSAQVLSDCEELGATLVDDTFDKEADYAITDSIILQNIEPKIRKYKNLVTNLWLVESFEAGIAIEIQFYHKPLAVVQQPRLRGETFVVTNYTGNERKYIRLLVEALGGVYSEVLKKADKAILITPTAEGKKFESAKIWNFAVLTVDWLLECVKQKRRVDETPYLIGDTAPSSRNILGHDSFVISSQDVYDDHDPPIENYIDENGPVDQKATPIRPLATTRLLNLSGTPKTPASPQLNISRLLVDMPTPQRLCTRSALMEARKPVFSPRKRRLEQLVNTPATRANMLLEEKPSPRPALPDCMLPPEKDYGIRPNSSPSSQSFHKRKLEGLDRNYVHRSPQKRARLAEEKNLEPTPPYSHRRYDFFKSRIQEYDSPDPRKTSTQSMIDVNRMCKSNFTNEASRFLDLDNDDDEASHKLNHATEDAFKEFDKLEKRASSDIRKNVNMQKIFEEESRDAEKGNVCVAPAESEGLVEWKDQEDSNDATKVQRQDVIIEEALPMSGNVDEVSYVFALNAFDEELKEDMIERITKLGGRYDIINFTHLITPKPNRSEKYLLGLSSARFIIHPDYIKACELNGRFIDEAKYEYGNPKFVPTIADSLKNENVFKAPYKWRKWTKVDHSARFEYGAFTGMTFIIATSVSKASQLNNIINAGGGKIVDVDFKGKLSAPAIKRERVQYCLTDGLNFTSKENMGVLNNCKVKVCPVKFISEYLMSNEAPMQFA